MPGYTPSPYFRSVVLERLLRRTPTHESPTFLLVGRFSTSSLGPKLPETVLDVLEGTESLPQTHSFE